MNVSVIGLGKLGAVLAAVLADAGHRVTGVDLSEHAVDCINQGVAPVPERGLQDLISELEPGRLVATEQTGIATWVSDITMIVVPTPSLPDGTFDPSYVRAAVIEVGRHLPKGWHTVVVCSTVMPGTMDDVIAPALEQASGRTVGETVGLCYSPEFIALGSVINDMQRPDSILVGARDSRSSKALSDLVESYVKNAPAFHDLTFREAELAKIAVNTFVTMKISYANTIAAISERLPGASSARVLAAVGADKRIGHDYLRPGASFGGPCFPRDNRAFAALGDQVGVDAALATATDVVNQQLVARTAHLLAQFNRVAILGLSYKPGTPVVEESMGANLATILSEAGVRVFVHDPQADVELPDEVERFDSISDTIANAEVVFIATPWREYSTVDFAGRIVIDAWNCTIPQPNRRVLGEHCWWWHA